MAAAIVATEDQGRISLFRISPRCTESLTLRMDALGIKVVTDYPSAQITKTTNGFSIAT